MPEKKRTMIQAKMIIAYQKDTHTLLKDGCIVFEDTRIVFVGKNYQGPKCTEIIDAADQIICPGFVNIHAHAHSPVTKSLREDVCNARHYMTNLYDMIPLAWHLTPKEKLDCTLFTMAELLRQGSTTVVIMGCAGYEEGLMEIIEKLGMRCYLVPSYRSATWKLSGINKIEYVWDEKRGKEGLERNVSFIKNFQGSQNGRILGLLGPDHADTCTEDLIKATRRQADDLGVGISIHASQSVFEFHEMVRRTGKTPLEYLYSLGLTGPDLIIAHGVFTSAHPLMAFPGGRDLEILSETGTNIAHCPFTFARCGNVMHSFGRYLKTGINLGIGTDSFPQDIIQEMRWAAIASKITDRKDGSVNAADIFNAATVGGAKALARRDLGRLEAGAKADFISFNLSSFSMAPIRDPLKNIVYSATGNDVDSVWIDGKLVMEKGIIPGIDQKELAFNLQKACEHLWETVPELDHQRRQVDSLSPPSLSSWQED